MPAGSTHTVIYAPSGPWRSSLDFQTHHQAYNFYARFDPATHATERAAHLKDYNKMLLDIASGTLPPVVWYKPTGNVNQHPGYANADDGDAHIAGLVDMLKASPQWKNMVIVVTYDEFGGQWDHVAPPKGDLLGPGTRTGHDDRRECVPGADISRSAARRDHSHQMTMTMFFHCN